MFASVRVYRREPMLGVDGGSELAAVGRGSRGR
jgi:hypothetical protein